MRGTTLQPQKALSFKRKNKKENGVIMIKEPMEEEEVDTASSSYRTGWKLKLMIGKQFHLHWTENI